MSTRIRNFKIPQTCHECVVTKRGICDIDLDVIVKQPTYISARHPNCPIEHETIFDRIRRKNE